MKFANRDIMIGGSSNSLSFPLRRKICYICEAYEGGVRKHLRDLFQYFTRPESQFDVHAVLGDRGEPGARPELEALSKSSPNFKFQILDSMRRPIRLFRDARAYQEIKEVLRGLQPAVIHTHSSKAGILGREAAKNLGLQNVLHTPHVFAFQWTSGIRGRIFYALERHAAKQCRKVICVGESQREDALKRELCGAEKMVVIRNGIKILEPLNADERARQRAGLGIGPSIPVVGMVARLAPQKGVGEFVRAAALILKERPEVVFLLVGGGSLEGEIRARIRKLKIPETSFRVLGHREDAQQLYAAFDVLVLSSLYEGLPYVLLEAMGRGLPVVATDVLGSRDVVADGETGFLARVNDPGHIAEKTLRILNDAAMLARFSANARKRVIREFSFESFVRDHEKLYSQ